MDLGFDHIQIRRNGGRLRSAARLIASICVASIATQAIAASESVVSNLPAAAIGALIDQDARIGYETGLVVHALDAYQASLRPAAAAFGLHGEPAVSAVVPGSGAAVAGVEPGDRLVSADGVAFARIAARPPSRGSLPDPRWFAPRPPTA